MEDKLPHDKQGVEMERPHPPHSALGPTSNSSRTAAAGMRSISSPLPQQTIQTLSARIGEPVQRHFGLFRGTIGRRRRRMNTGG